MEDRCRDEVGMLLTLELLHLSLSSRVQTHKRVMLELYSKKRNCRDLKSLKDSDVTVTVHCHHAAA